jgi:hypothetical protein
LLQHNEPGFTTYERTIWEGLKNRLVSDTGAKKTE